MNELEQTIKAVFSELKEIHQELKEVRKDVIRIESKVDNLEKQLNVQNDILQTFKYDIDLLTVKQATAERDINRINKRLEV